MSYTYVKGTNTSRRNYLQALQLALLTPQLANGHDSEPVPSTSHSHNLSP
jgi:hypothetical protein